ncbi:MAG: hypothetical protein GY754_42375 [bacterium]|nr:hypothetical protein [bacterium]
MKRTFFLIPALCLTLMALAAPKGLFAQQDIENEPESAPVSTETASEGKTFYQEFTSPGLHNSKLLLFGGQHKHLYGYTDARYVGADKGDYLESRLIYGGLELVSTDFSSWHSSLDDVSFGTNLNFYTIGGKSGETYLQASTWPITYLRTDIPGNDNEKGRRYGFNFGFFGGIDKKWYGLTGGLTGRVKHYTETNRKRRVIDEDGNPVMVTDPNTGSLIEQTVDIKGRGLVADGEFSIRPNLFLRLGMEDKAHFTFSIFQEDYNPVYGIIQTKLVIPVNSYFTMKVGGYLYETTAIFVEPELNLGDFSISAKAGTFIGYKDDVMSKVDLVDSLFASASISYRWK